MLNISVSFDCMPTEQKLENVKMLELSAIRNCKNLRSQQELCELFLLSHISTRLALFLAFPDGEYVKN